MEIRQEFLSQCALYYDELDPVTTSALTLMDLSQKTFQMGIALGRRLLQSRLKRDPRAALETAPLCQACHKPLRIQQKAQKRTIQTVLGDIDYRRAYCVCDRCGKSRVPLDEALGIPPKGPSVDALHKVCHAAVATRSFEGASCVLNVQAGLKIPRKRIRHWAETEGKNLVEEQKDEVQQYQEGKVWKRPATIPDLFVITADGGRVQTRQTEKKDRWKESKIGVVYDALKQPNKSALRGEYKGARANTKTYVATMDSWGVIGWRLRVEAEKKGYSNAREKVFLGDGASGVKDVRDTHFSEATFILDWAHAAEHLSDCSKAIFGEGTTKAYRWYEKYANYLWEGNLDEIIRELNKQSKALGMPRPQDGDFSRRTILYRNAYSYFPNNKTAMNYPLFRSKGWPIGSGVVEGAVKQFALRLKGSEKFWNIANKGADEMLALCALYFSEDGRWEQYWRRRARPYTRE